MDNLFVQPNCCIHCWQKLIEPQIVKSDFQMISSGSYEGAFRELISRAKFKNHPASIQLLKRIAIAVSDALQGEHFDLITSVPADPRRLRKRGIDLPYEIARTVAKRRKSTFDPRIIQRVRSIPSQQNLNQVDRMKNVEGAFLVDQPMEGKTVLIVDDVYTTGATAKAIAKEFQDQNVAQIIFYTLARTPI